MTGVLFQTLAWTGVLIAAVLVLRRPVSRHFGPEAAYALWLLPLLRLVVPPLTLPAWMAPAAPLPVPAAPIPEAPPAPDAAFWQAATQVPAGAVPAPLTVPMKTGAQPGFDLFALIADWPLAETLLVVWLGGAGVFLWQRFAAYFALRAALLAEGREVGRIAGRIGKVRLVETPATSSPLAMGVIDRVIALPPGFLALHDRTGRDLALAHELAHHRGGDLLVNILVQPLFALHWFNPLARYGWLALRRDQEAACDARVMARRSARERAAYAMLIARFAAAPVGGAHNAALTAPMACPVLGETSIIHRLRSLAMSDPTPRRRLAGRALLGAGLLALPLTASITYAAGESVFAAPEPPEAPLPPLPPEAPEAPQAPEPPEPPEAPEPPAVLLLDVPNPDGVADPQLTEKVWRDADGKEHRVTIVTRGGPEAEARALHGEAMERMDKAEQEAMVAEVRAALAAADQELAELPRMLAAVRADAAAANAEARAAGSSARVIVKEECRRGSEEVTETTNRDGVQVISICQRRIMASARKGLEEARAEIARDRDIPEDTRRQLLRTLDGQIARWRDRES